MINLLITGACGFLGTHVSNLMACDQRVDGLFLVDNIEPTCGGRDDASRVRCSVDVTDHDALTSFMGGNGITHVIHLVALGRNLNCQGWPLRAWEVNLMGTVNVLEASRLLNLTRVVTCSSNITLCPDMTTYKATKLAAELAVLAYQRYGLSCQALRPSNIHGSGQSSTEFQPCAFAGLNASYKQNGCFSITGDGSQTRDFVHADDVARAFQLALFSTHCGPALDIATGEMTSMNALASMLGVPVTYLPSRPGDALAIVSDPQPAKAALGFTAMIPLRSSIWDSFPDVPRMGNALDWADDHWEMPKAKR